MLLELRDLVTRYGAVEALHGIALDVGAAEIVALLGANGAGKSTTLKTISRVIAPASGTVTFDGRSLDGLTPEDVVALGIAHVPEGRRIFPGLTVLDNLRLGATPRRATRAEIDRDLDAVIELFPKLRTLATKLGWTLSGGEQQMLAIARGLMAKPRLLLLDEPSLGLAPLIVTGVMETIARIAREGTTVLLVEQNAHLALQIANRAYVLETGRVALSGPASDLLTSDEMRRAYLGSAVRTRHAEPTSP
ncbi:ABC transporter ATP-binding protein [Vulcanimicrobium alpinum]|uniref:ABC transporter ATP-binding protein n=1 Tax=Vulcanimicrobium alpinum TaxID=3016050 RepID=A0AAN1XYV7_UNVUL|nr:ABC transporter ATP-binding protein [Vulcanimicrobium alpinum]BDE06742.1 ABC transporter ATP-binding protein [Vulcanimicrobium alpinum]